MIYKILLPILLTFNLTIAQNVLNGKILDAVTKQPVVNAVVYFNNNYHYTGPQGTFTLKTAVAGTTIKITSIGYTPLLAEIKHEDLKVEKVFYLTPSAVELDEVVVSSRRTENYLKNSPYSENLLEAQEINKYPAFSVTDLLQKEAGISLMKDGVWGTDINLRGLSRQNVVTLINGTRIETATDIAARLSMIEINDIERVEVIKGAASSIYGSGATGGIVNIVTRPAIYSNTFALNGNLSAGYNSVNNSYHYYGGVFSGGSFWSSKLSGSFRRAGDLTTPAGTVRNSRFKDYSINGMLNISPFENHSLNFDYQLFKGEDIGIPGASSLFPGTADVRYPEEERNLFSAGYEIKNLSSMLNKISLKYSYQYILRSVENIPYIVQMVPAANNQPARRVSVLKIAPTASHYYNGVNLQALLLAGNNHSINTGIDYWERKYSGLRERHQKIEVLNSEGNTVNTINKVIGEKPLPDSKFANLGFFIQDDFKAVPEKLSLSIGARVDKINVTGSAASNPVYEITNGVISYAPASQNLIWKEASENDFSYSANAGLLYSLSSSVNLSLSLGYSFRSPSLEERFQYIDLGSLLRLGNPDLESETGRSVDFGIRYYSSDLRIISSLFYNYFSDLVVERPGSYEGRPARIKDNAGRARLYGFDISTEYSTGSFIIYTNAAYVKGDDLTAGGSLPEIPPLNGVAGLRYKISNIYLAEVYSNIFAAQNSTAPGEVTTPGYAVFNFILSANRLKFGGTEVTLSGGIENILDKHYRSHLSSARGGIWVEPGRNFFIKLMTGW